MKPENLTLSPTDAAPAVARTCPRCSHVRKPTDDAPAWQCPRCEVAYDKVLPAETASRHDRNKPVARTRPAPQRPWTLILLAGMVAAMLGLVGWKWQSRQAQTAERAARAQNDALAAQVNAERARLDGVQQLADAERQWRHNQGPQALSTVQTMANSGNARAMVLLSAMLSEGRDIAKDHALAMDWLRKAAAQGSALAWVRLGYIYEKGLGEPRQPSLAENWYLKAARQGDPSGLYSLGLLYTQNLEGVGQRPVAAHMLLTLATRAQEANPQNDSLTPHNHSAFWAQGALRRLSETMAVADVAEARRRADAWRPGMPLEF